VADRGKAAAESWRGTIRRGGEALATPLVVKQSCARPQRGRRPLKAPGLSAIAAKAMLSRTPFAILTAGQLIFGRTLGIKLKNVNPQHAGPAQKVILSRRKRHDRRRPGTRSQGRKDDRGAASPESRRR